MKLRKSPLVTVSLFVILLVTTTAGAQSSNGDRVYTGESNFKHGVGH